MRVGRFVRNVLKKTWDISVLRCCYLRLMENAVFKVIHLQGFSITTEVKGGGEKSSTVEKKKTFC